MFGREAAYSKGGDPPSFWYGNRDLKKKTPAGKEGGSKVTGCLHLGGKSSPKLKKGDPSQGRKRKKGGGGEI